MLQTAVSLQPKTTTEAAKSLISATAEEVVMWALEEYSDKICVTTSFTDTVLIDLVLSIAPKTPVVFLDTGFHFSETLKTMKLAQDRYGMNLRVVKPAEGAPDLWNAGYESCCAARKVSGLQSLFESGEFVAWFSGLRRSDSVARKNAPIVSTDKQGRIKVNPLATWDDEKVAEYAAKKDLISNPLLQQGYTSLGCWPCTQKNDDAANPRAGRWSNTSKTECGLHY